MGGLSAVKPRGGLSGGVRGSPGLELVGEDLSSSVLELRREYLGII